MGRYFYAYMVMLAALITTTSFSYPTPVDFEGVLLRWDIGPDDGPITYFVAADDPEAQANLINMVMQAADEWSAIEHSYFRLQRTDNENSAHITVYLQNELNNSPAAAGYTTFDEHDGKHPRHCSIYLATPDGNGSYAFAKTALHEFGHCAGLGHSLIPEAIMSYSLSTNNFRLDTDDIAAISRLYPADGSDPQLPPGCAITTSSHRLTGSSNWLLLLLCLAPLGVCWTHRRPNFY